MAIFSALSALQVFGTIAGGFGKGLETDLEAFNTETENKFNNAAASQQARARMDEHESATATNLASFAAAGRDIGSDRSVEAFLNKQREVATEDVSRIQKQETRASNQYKAEQARTKRSGKTALAASLFSAAGQAADSYSRYNDIKR
jgi:hypothetical protein